jgi:arsenite methyltransferase
LDSSFEAVQCAKQRYADFVKAGRAVFQEGVAASLPFTVNTVYFWPALEPGFREMRRVLSPGGRAAIGFLPRQHMERMGVPKDIFQTREVEEIEAALLNSGFTGVESARPSCETPWTIITAGLRG